MTLFPVKMSPNSQGVFNHWNDFLLLSKLCSNFLSSSFCGRSSPYEFGFGNMPHGMLTVYRCCGEHYSCHNPEHDIHNTCQNNERPSTFHVAYFWKPKLHIKLYTSYHALYVTMTITNLSKNSCHLLGIVHTMVVHILAVLYYTNKQKYLPCFIISINVCNFFSVKIF